MACFWAPDHKPEVTLSVDFEWKSGMEAKDWTNVAKKGSVDVSDSNSFNSVGDEVTKGSKEAAIRFPSSMMAGLFICPVIFTGNQQERQKITKQIPEFNATTFAPTVPVTISTASKDESYNDTQEEQPLPVSTAQFLTSSNPFRCDNTWSSFPADLRNNPTDINIPLHGQQGISN